MHERALISSSISHLSLQSEHRSVPDARKKSSGQSRSRLEEEEEREAVNSRELYPLARVLAEVVYQERQYWERTHGVHMPLNTDGTLMSLLKQTIDRYKRTNKQTCSA